MRTRRAFALLFAGLWLFAGSARPARADGAPEAAAAEPPPPRYPFAPGREHADDFVPYETFGPALSAGIGELYAGFGAELAYYVIPQRELALAIAPHVGAGFAAGPSGFEGQLGVRGGALVAYGAEQRWLLDAAFGALHTHGLSLHGLPAASRIVSGVSLAAGVERMDRRGLFVRALVGGYALTSRAVADDDRLGILVTIGAGWKPW